MNAAHRGLSWDENERKGKTTALCAALVLVASLFATAIAPSPTTASTNVDVIVREANPASTAAESLVERLGGRVLTQLTIIGGFSATVPAGTIERLASDPSIEAATPNASLGLLEADWVDDNKYTPGYSAWEAAYTMYAVGFMKYAGVDGSGVDVALIDSGVVPVNGLTYPGKIIDGPDLSFESQAGKFLHLDTYGHGTHMAGIIAGRDDGLTSFPGKHYQSNFDEYQGGFMGVAPGSRIVNVKVAGHDGATDVSQVIAAIDWVVQHKNDNGMNIRVLNLSFGTDSTQSYLLDPLAYAVEQAWNAGIVVVVAAGNDGNKAALRNPALDPFVIAVGATDSNGSYSISNDFVTNFSNCGTAERSVDVVAPGRSIRGLKAPNSRADIENPNASYGDRFIKGSGTSQAAAMVSGAAALLVDKYPQATPDQVKALLMNNAWDLKYSSGLCEGAGAVSLYGLWNATLPKVEQTHAPSKGTGSLHAARGSVTLEDGGVALEKEADIFGKAWDPIGWATASAQGTSWSGGDWNGTSWSGTSWSGTSWSGTSWSGTSWSGTSWSGVSWSGTSWSNQIWTGTSWSGTSWTGTSWSGTSWTSNGWSGASWR